MTVVNLTVTTESEDIFPMQMDSEDGMHTLHGYIEAVTGLKADDQVLIFDGKPLAAAPTLSAAGIRDNSLLHVLPKARTPAAQQSPYSLNPDGSAVDPNAFMAAIRNDASQMARLRQWPVGEAIASNNVEGFQAALRKIKEDNDAREAEEALPDDPLDPEYQRKMYERIQKKNIDDNYVNALEHSPEVFASVEMLYVDMAVNGEPLKAFIDSGAQMTIMTQQCAEKCSIMRLVDTRFTGLAVGVGSSKIVGRIHTCAVKVGDQYIASSITVLEQKTGPQFIFGLDNLRRHHCSIDLQKGMLNVHSCGVTLPFLPEHEVPKDFNIERQRGDNEKDELDASGSSPRAVEGDLSALRRTSSLTQSGPMPIAPRDGVSAPASSSQPFQNLSSQPASATSAAEVPPAALQLQQITGKDLKSCIDALRRANGNLDVAASDLLGF